MKISTETYQYQNNSGQYERFASVRLLVGSVSALEVTHGFRHNAQFRNL